MLTLSFCILSIKLYLVIILILLHNFVRAFDMDISKDNIIIVASGQGSSHVT